MDKNFKPKKRVIKIEKKYIFIAIGVFFVIGGIIIGRQFTWKNIEADQVAVLVNNLTGNVKAITRAGAVLYYPYIQDIYILDRPEQVLKMTSANISKKYPRGNPVVIRTIDGGEVALDITIQYRIIPEMANDVIRNSGKNLSFKLKWLYDYGRTICRYNYGELSISEFPNSSKRDEKSEKAAAEINKMINKYGLMVTSINILDYRYYREYAEKILERRLADKEIEEQKAMTAAAKRNKEKVVIEETRKMEVEIARFQGELEKRILEAEGEAARTRNNADTYLVRSRIEGGAEFERLFNMAKAVFAQKKAEAKGIRELKMALEGPGGRNLVKMEYAKRLKNATIRGTPVLKAARENPQVRYFDSMETFRMERTDMSKEKPTEGQEIPVTAGQEKRYSNELPLENNDSKQ
ncbi:MAG: SPFH domain-containing protein [Candidatus Anammoxibacter sp.]